MAEIRENKSTVVLIVEIMQNIVRETRQMCKELFFSPEIYISSIDVYCVEAARDEKRHFVVNIRIRLLIWKGDAKGIDLYSPFFIGVIR